MDASTRTQRVAAAAAALIADAGVPLPLPTLIAGLAARLPLVPAPVLKREVASAAAAGLLTVVNGLVEAPSPDSHDSLREVAFPADDRPLRAIVVDVESVVRLAPSTEDLKDARIWQIGAVRLSVDSGWASAEPRFTRYCSLPEGWENELRSADARAAVASLGEPIADALAAFREFCGDADVLVAYNGVGVDFPLLAAASQREGLPPPSGLHVDAFYLALCLWPFPPRSHRLAELAGDVGVDVSGLRWHDACDDAELTARLLREGATRWASLPVEMRSLLAAVTAGSMAWRLLSELAFGTVLPRAAVYDDANVASVLTAALDHLPVRRTPQGMPGAGVGPLRLPIAVRAQGMVSPAALASFVAGDRVEERPAQEQMASLMRGWLPTTDGAIEAATGIGKSLALLAVAFDWLAADDTHRVVIATHTKQLQTQLARDVATLAAPIPDVLDLADVVKGAANRLSLRALVTAIVDTADAAAGGSGAHTGHRTAFAADPAYAELVALLVLRLYNARQRIQQWSARSVDAADLPAFLGDYLPARYPSFLKSLSQETGEYRSSTGLADRTDDVNEAIGGHRLVLTNHALLLSHLEAFAATGGDTLLLIDEAHTLEGAATDALTATFALYEVEQCLYSATQWLAVRGQRSADTTRIAEAVDSLRRFCDAEQLPAAIGRLLDQRSSRPLGNAGPGRVATLASPFPAEYGEDLARAVILLTRRAASFVSEVAAAMWEYLGSTAGSRLDWFARERTRQLATRLTALESAARRVVDDAQAILGPVNPGTAPLTGRVTAARPVAPTSDESEDTGLDTDTETPIDIGAEDVETGEVDVEAAEETALHADSDVSNLPDTSDADGPGARAARVLTTVSNRVICVFEDSDDRPAPTLREYRAHVATAPIELPLDHSWQQFRSVFARTFLTSATLRVSGGWQFLFRRLGLSGIETCTLDTPFDLRRQVRVVAFSDFPSWAEQSRAAVRTVAHQLTGYAREVMRPASGDGRLVAYNGGALVLTTARRSAADIGAQLALGLATANGGDDDPPIPVHAAGLLGNARAVSDFAARGGFCVGTKGLWAGVDIQPAERLKLVWINKLPFVSADEPVTAARRAAVAAAAAEDGVDDPDLFATESYYLPLAALEVRQAVGRLVRSADHSGVVIISDRKLAGDTRQRRAYRRIFLESLEEGLHLADPITGEKCGGNVVSMTDGWAGIWRFLASLRVLSADRAKQLCTDDALADHTLLPQTRRIRNLAFTKAELNEFADSDALAAAVLDRCAEIGGLLNLADAPLSLKDEQQQVIDAAARGRDVLAVLPTGFGKSYTFQLPALVAPGVTLVVSPLVALMTDQALELNQTIGGAVRALVAPMSESVSRRGKSEVADQLTGINEHGIKIVYLSPERLCQRRMRETVEAAVAAGVIGRIAIDEAHTFVQWGDDFRPSFRRLEVFLRRLRSRYQLPLTAVTATATRSVLDGLRSGLFGLETLPATAPGPEAAAVPAGRGPNDPDSFTFVAANPLRTSLALYKRTFQAGTGGPVALAGLVERIIDALDGHAILYCLTVREVNALAAALRAYVGDTGKATVMRFHSRLSEAEKQSVAFAFREAPAADEDGYQPMIVVATSAFGLGVDRKDIRCVTVVSPPTDLAALYQQLGRAGRDGKPATGVALATGRGLRTVAFFADLGLPVATVVRIGSALLRLAYIGSAGGFFALDAERLAVDCLTADLAAGNISAALARRPGTADSYRTAVLQTVAALCADGVLDDRGDYPTAVAVLPGERRCPDPELRPLVDSVLVLAARQPRCVLDVSVAHLELVASPGWAEFADDPGGTWNLLAAFHDRGWLDVSQAPCRGRTHTCIVVPTDSTLTIPATFVTRIGAHRARARAELGALRGFLSSRACLNAGFAEYLASTDPGVCAAGPICRCSSCWGNSGEPGERRPALLEAVLTPHPQPLIARDAPHRLARLDEQVRTLLWDIPYGLTAGMLTLVLKGGETYFSLRSGVRRPLWPQLLYHKLRGTDPALRISDVEAALNRLAAAGVAANPIDTLWRLQRHIDAEKTRAARDAS